MTEFTYRSAKYRATYPLGGGDPMIEILVHEKGWQGVKSPERGLIKAAGKARDAVGSDD